MRHWHFQQIYQIACLLFVYAATYLQRSKGIFLYIRKRELYGPLLREQSLRSLPLLCFDLSSGSEGDGNADLDASYPMIKKRVSLERQLLEKVPLKMGEQDLFLFLRLLMLLQKGFGLACLIDSYVIRRGQRKVKRKGGSYSSKSSVEEQHQASHLLDQFRLVSIPQGSTSCNSR